MLSLKKYIVEVKMAISNKNCAVHVQFCRTAIWDASKNNYDIFHM